MLQTAKREFREETGLPIDGDFIALTPLRQSGGKVVHAWAVQSEIDPSRVKSNTFALEWPPRSGAQQQFPESTRPNGSPFPKPSRGCCRDSTDSLRNWNGSLGIAPTA